MSNRKVVSETEHEGIQFLKNFRENIRETELINSQINSIQQIVGMLQNELSKTDCDLENMDSVFLQEQELLTHRGQMSSENDHKVVMDLRDQQATLEQQIADIKRLADSQNDTHDKLSTKQQQVLDELEKESQELDDEKKALEKKKADLQKENLTNQKENEEKKFKNKKMECSIKQFEVKTSSMDTYLKNLVNDNVGQFEDL